jgi:hypothetical protein
MAGGAISFSQSLRVIGQELESLGVDAFELGKLDDEYVVQMDGNGTAGKLSNNTLLKRISEKFHGVDSQIPSRLRFSTEQIIRSDIERAVRRAETSGIPNSGSLPLILRVLGNFLDERGADNFTILCSSDGVKVNYDRKLECFTTDNLYDLGVRMYLRRSGRVSSR